MGALRDLPVDKARQRVLVELAVLERRDERRQRPLEHAFTLSCVASKSLLGRSFLEKFNVTETDAGARLRLEVGQPGCYVA